MKKKGSFVKKGEETGDGGKGSGGGRKEEIEKKMVR